MEAAGYRLLHDVACWTRPGTRGLWLQQAGPVLAQWIWVLFVLVQALDGAMTFVGIHMFGTHAEANPLILWYAGALGPATAVWAAKLFAVGCGVALHLTARHGTLAALVVVYVVGAVGPWLHIFWRHPNW